MKNHNEPKQVHLFLPVLAKDELDMEMIKQLIKVSPDKEHIKILGTIDDSYGKGYVTDNITAFWDKEGHRIDMEVLFHHFGKDLHGISFSRSFSPDPDRETLDWTDYI